MIAEGRYQAKASPSVEFGRTLKNGTQFVRLQFEITSEGEFRGHQIHWDGWLTEKTAERTMDSLEHCGWDGASLSSPQGIGSKECSIVIEHEEYTNEQGETKKLARVKWVNALSNSKLKDEMKLDAGALRNLDQEFKASLLERRQRTGSPSISTPRANQRPAQRRSEPDEMPDWLNDDPENFPR